MNLKSLSAWLVILSATMATAVPPVATRVTADPNDPAKTRPIVSFEEREAMGLEAHTWSGVLHPDLYPTLDNVERTVADLKARLAAKNGKDIEAFDGLSRIAYPHMVYVQIQLTDMAAQHRVLESLTAAQIHHPYLFRNAPGLTGYVTRDGLQRLAQNADVVGVCLDDKPLPHSNKIIDKGSLPSAQPGEAADEPGVREGLVDPDVYRAFAFSDRVTVDVSLRTESLTRWGDLPADPFTRNELRDKAYEELQNRVLSAINARGFWLLSKSGSGMSGSVDRAGLDILRNHPDVLRVGLPNLMRMQGSKSSGR